MENIFNFEEFLNENMNDKIEFSDNRIKSIRTSFNSLPLKYVNNKFFKSIMQQLEKNKKLTKKQYDNLSYLLRHGRSMYEDGYLTTKN